MRREILLLGSVLVGLAMLLSRGSETDVGAGTALRLDVEDLVQHAELVFEGRVRSATALVVQHGLIETEYLIDIQRTFEGAEQATRTVRLPGGILPNGDGMILPGMPQLLPGEDVILFLSHASPSGVRMPVGLAQGKFRVETRLDGHKRLSRSQASLSLVDSNSGAMLEEAGAEVFEYAEVLAQIYAGLSQEQGK